MAGEVKEWFALADDLFGGFGDVVKTASVITKTQGAYDSATGSYLQTEVTITTQAVKTEMNKDFIVSKGAFANEFAAWMIRGSDFATITDDTVVTSPPEANEEFSLVGGAVSIINQVDDPTGIGAYYLIHVKEM